MDYDFFLAHASADLAAAEELYDLLITEASVFIDSRSLVLGDDWDRALAEAQQQSRVTIVLVSANTDMAFYQREEIAAAIDMARQDSKAHRVVPVYLEPAPRNVPYGLRLKHGLAVSPQRTVEHVAARLLDLHRSLTVSVKGSGTERAATPLPDAARSKAELLVQLFDGDPVVSLPAVAGLTELGPSVVPDVVSRLSGGHNQVKIIAARTLLGRFPEESGPLMSSKVLNAHQDWHGATQVPDCFSPRHRPFCADLLAQHLDDGEPDVVRKCIESLGFMAAETWGYRLEELLRSVASSDYYYGKYQYYLILAQARILVLLEADPIEVLWGLPETFGRVERVLKLSAQKGWAGTTFMDLSIVIKACQPRHADHLITAWLTADQAELRTLAANALGQMRLRRSLPYLVDLAKAKGESSDMVQSSASAIANIGGPGAVSALDELLRAVLGDKQRSAHVLEALVHCIADAADDDQFARLADVILAHPPLNVSFLHRAVGLRQDDRFLGELHRGLESTQPTVRGQSALALARIGGMKDRATLVRAHFEAATPFERVLTSLSLILIGVPVPGDPELERLRVDLADNSFQYRRLVTDDIIEVLSASQAPQAAPIADAWRGIYEEGPDY